MKGRGDMNSKSISTICLTTLIFFAGFQTAGFAQTEMEHRSRGAESGSPGLQSKLFKGDPKLEACLVNDSDHIKPGAVGDHVAKIQTALIMLDDPLIGVQEVAAKRYGPLTAKAVLEFKRTRKILNSRGQVDDTVGKKTIDAMDKEVKRKGK